MLGRPRSPGEEWKCEESDGQFKCNSVSLKTRFSVAHDTRDERKIKVIRGGKALQIRLSRSKVEVEDRHFKPLSTSQFKTTEI